MSETNINKQLDTENVIWNLSDLYSNTSDPQITKDFEFCEKEAENLRDKYSGRLAELSVEDFQELIERYENLDSVLTKLGTYSFLNFTTQIDNSEAGALDQKVHEIYNRCSAVTVFFELEWAQLPEEKAAIFLNSAKLGKYHHYLTNLRKLQPHLLSNQEESLLREKEVTGRNSWTTLFEKVFAHLKFGEKQRTEEEVLTDLYHPEREIRKQAAIEMTAGLNSQLHILTHIFNTLAAEKMVTDRLRKYDSWLSSMNLDNQLQDKTVDVLIEAVTSRYDIVSRYYNIKKEILGLDNLYDYDRYAPLPDLPGQTVTWQECKNIVLNSFADFSPKIAQAAELIYTNNWIHAPILETKRGGAFAHPCVPEVHPYVLVNYTGNLRDVSTVAHELGHGVHQVLAAGQGHFNSNTPLPLAETASVFGELLVFQTQLKLIEDPAQKRAFICQKLESIFATVFRQTAMNRFENAMHTGRRESGELSPEQLSEFWLASQQEMFGDSVELTDDYKIWWSCIPHFLSTPGYVYSYAFGELLVLALYGVYLEEGEPFVDKYITLLASGGSASPYELLEPFGFDIDEISFWQKGLKVIEDMVQSIS